MKKSILFFSILIVSILFLEFTGLFKISKIFLTKSKRLDWINTNLASYKEHKKESLLKSGDCKKILSGARKQLSSTKRYDPSYFKLSFPNGDIDNDIGVCADIIVRSFREIGLDLQKEIHLDIKARRTEYPRIWSQLNPDSNIDHRRVPNQMVFFN